MDSSSYTFIRQGTTKKKNRTNGPRSISSRRRYSRRRVRVASRWPKGRKDPLRDTFERRHNSRCSCCTAFRPWREPRAHRTAACSTRTTTFVQWGNKRINRLSNSGKVIKKKLTNKAGRRPAICSTIHRLWSADRWVPAGIDTTGGRKRYKSIQCIPFQWVFV